MIQILVGIVLGIIGIVVLLIIIYIASGIQARAWLDIFDKYFSDKLKK